jgi:hypothetical protein
MNRFLTSWTFTYALAFALLVGMFALRAADPSPLQTLRNKTFDVMQQTWPRQEPAEGYPIGVRIIDLGDVAVHAPPAHGEAVGRARSVVDAAVEGFRRIEAGRLADPAIIALRERVQATMASELERAERRHANQTLLAVTGALDRFASELLHIPSVRIRELVAEGRGDEAMAALELLFGVEPDVVELGRQQDDEQQQDRPPSGRAE